jgi:hypothetical protein
VHQAATTNRLILRDCPLPPCKVKLYLKQVSGQATSASGSSVKMFPKRKQGTT